MNSTGFEDELRRGLRDLATYAPEVPERPTRVAEGSDGVEAYPARALTRPNSKILAMCAAALVVVAGLVALVAARDDEGPQVVTDTTITSTVPTTTSASPTTTSTPSQPAPTGSVARIPSGPGYGLTFPAMVWTGSELIIWGGEVVSEEQWSDRGAAYDPTTGTWRELAPSPLPPMSEHTAIWTGGEMIICCGRIPEANGVTAAAYRPETDTWRTLTPPPFGRAPFAQSVWTGTEMIVTGGSDYRGAAAYDPSTDTWRTLADPPGIIERVADSAWTGQQMVLWDGSSREAFTYDPKVDTWATLPEVPEQFGLTGGTGTVVGDDFVVWGARGDEGPEIEPRATGAILDLGERTWRALPEAIIEPGRRDEGTRTSPSSTSTGAEMIVFAGSIGGGREGTSVPVLAYNPATESWRTLGSAPRSHRPPMVWADGTAFLLGGDLFAITP